MPSGVRANPPVVQIALEREVVTRLRREAARRDMSAVSLARAVLDTVVGDNLGGRRRRRPPQPVEGPRVASRGITSTKRPVVISLQQPIIVAARPSCSPQDHQASVLPKGGASSSNMVHF
jgi:hypothetical protein